MDSKKVLLFTVRKSGCREAYVADLITRLLHEIYFGHGKRLAVAYIGA